VWFLSAGVEVLAFDGCFQILPLMKAKELMSELIGRAEIEKFNVSKG
jgi:hypothetical protein